jgi:putative iron-only hydrogenase system regulator
MEKRVAVTAIIVENKASVEELNAILHEYSDYIIGRMGVPYREKGISCITVVIDADMNTINSLCGKIGKLDGVSSKTAFSNV